MSELNNVTIQMKEFGSNGRLGNQFFQLLFLTFLREKFGCKISFSENTLSKLLQINPDSELSNDSTTLQLEQYTNREIGPNNLISLINSNLKGSTFKTLDIGGYFQFHTNFYRSISHIFRISISKLNALPISNSISHLESLRSSFHIVGIHTRLGDYLNLTNRSNIFWVPEFNGTRDLITDILATRPQNLIVYLASDDLNLASKQLNENGISFISRLTFGFTDNSPEAEIFDFVSLSFAKYLLIANSTYSLAAAMCADATLSFYRPLGRLGKMVPFDPWNSDVLLSSPPGE